MECRDRDGEPQSQAASETTGADLPDSESHLVQSWEMPTFQSWWRKRILCRTNRRGLETQERQGHGDQGSNVGDHRYIAQGPGEEEAGVPPQHEALGRPNKNRSGSEGKTNKKATEEWWSSSIKKENVCLDGCYGDYVSQKKISKTVGEIGACPWTGSNNEEGARASDGQCLERTCPVPTLRPGSLSLQPIILCKHGCCQPLWELFEN